MLQVILKKLNDKRYLGVILLCFGTLMLCQSCYYFIMGFHDVDLSYNICVLVNDKSQEGLSSDYRNQYDITSSGNHMYYTSVYSRGHNAQFRNFMIAIFGGLLFGSGLMVLLENLKK